MRALPGPPSQRQVAAQAARPCVRPSRRRPPPQLLLRRVSPPQDPALGALLRQEVQGCAGVPGGVPDDPERQRSRRDGQPHLGDSGGDAAPVAPMVAGGLPGDGGLAVQARRAGQSAWSSVPIFPFSPSQNPTPERNARQDNCYLEREEAEGGSKLNAIWSAPLRLDNLAIQFSPIRGLL